MLRLGQTVGTRFKGNANRDKGMRHEQILKGKRQLEAVQTNAQPGEEETMQEEQESTEAKVQCEPILTSLRYAASIAASSGPTMLRSWRPRRRSWQG